MNDLEAEPKPWLRRLMLVTSLALSMVAQGCAGALYRIKPAAELPPLSAAARSASAGGITVRAEPLLTDEQSQDLFEANLPASSLLPVRIEIANESGALVELKRARLRLRDGEGRDWTLLPPKKAVSQILKANAITTYNPDSRKQFVKEVSEYAIDLKTPLAASERRHGFLFFQAPKKEIVVSPRALVLTVDGLPQVVEIKLN